MRVSSFVRVSSMVVGLAVAAAPLAGCGGTRSRALPRSAAAYNVIGAPVSDERVDYPISPLDVISVTVFREPDLTFKEIQVDASGKLLFPLIGSVDAAGKSATVLSRELAQRLDQRYLRDPQVSVVVVSSTSQRVTVEGSVTEPGVYELGGNATLLEALARAKSPTRTAALDQVVVFRRVDGKRTGAVFNLRKIRNGEAADPRILGGDVVVVGFSALKGAFRDFLQSAPLLGAFRAF